MDNNTFDVSIALPASYFLDLNVGGMSIDMTKLPVEMFRDIILDRLYDKVLDCTTKGDPAKRYDAGLDCIRKLEAGVWDRRGGRIKTWDEYLETAIKFAVDNWFGKNCTAKKDSKGVLRRIDNDKDVEHIGAVHYSDPAWLAKTERRYAAYLEEKKAPAVKVVV